MRLRLAGTSAVVALLLALFPDAGRTEPRANASTARQPPSVEFGVYDPGRAFSDAHGIGIEHIYVYW